MDIFYTSVLGVAAVLLILILTYIGIMLTVSTKKTAKYPPVANLCPDYWEVVKDGSGCVVPVKGGKNIGTLRDNAGGATGALTATSGYKSISGSGAIIDFTDNGWAKSGTAICNKNTWAKTNNIVWDGVSNYNSCITLQTSTGKTTTATK